MELSQQLIQFLQYLIPGFLAAWVFYGFAAHKRPSQFERIIEALVFTLIIQALVFMERPVLLWLGQWGSLGNWNTNSPVIASSVTAVFMGLFFALCANRDFPHVVLRSIGVTRETTGPNEWFRAFYEEVTYIVLHLRDGRRLYGWVARFPPTPNTGEFVIRNPRWVHTAKTDGLTDVTSILIRASDVEWVEFLKKDWIKDDTRQKWRFWRRRKTSDQRGPKCTSPSEDKRSAATTTAAAAAAAEEPAASK